MGIYPVQGTKDHVRQPDGSETWTETDDTPGLHRERQVKAGQWSETRTDCFCCTCEYQPGSDPACRNHGSHGRRPCEEHDQPGSNWEEPDGSDGPMPDSVQVYRARRARNETAVN